MIRTELFALYSINYGKLTCVPNHDISQKLFEVISGNKAVFVQPAVVFLNRVASNFVLSSENDGYISKTHWHSSRTEAKV